MSEEVKKKKKQIEVDVVELKIELSEVFFNNMDKAKKQVADKRGYDISYGEYIEEAMNDLVKMVEEYSNKIIEASQIIQKQDEALGQIEIVEKPEQEKPEPEEGESVPDVLYGHLAENYKNDPMIG